MNNFEAWEREHFPVTEDDHLFAGDEPVMVQLDDILREWLAE